MAWLTVSEMVVDNQRTANKYQLGSKNCDHVGMIYDMHIESEVYLEPKKKEWECLEAGK